MHRDILGEGTPVGKAGLCLVTANLLVAGMALRAGAATGDKGHGDPVTHPEAANVAANGFDDAGKFVPRYVGQGNIRVMAHPAMPVAAANAGCHHLDDHAFLAGFGGIHRHEFWGGGEAFVDYGFHCGSLWVAVFAVSVPSGLGRHLSAVARM